MPVTDGVLVGLAVVGFVVVRSVVARPLRQDAPWVLNVLLLGYGVALLASGLGSVTRVHPVSVTGWLLLALNVPLAVAVGLARARTVRVWRTATGVPMRRGSWRTVAVWVVGLLAHVGLDLGVDSANGTGRLGLSSIVLYVAITVIVQNAALRSTERTRSGSRVATG